MRTEVKIGIAAAAFIAVVAVIYIVLADIGTEVQTKGNRLANKPAPKAKSEAGVKETRGGAPEATDAATGAGAGTGAVAAGEASGSADAMTDEDVRSAAGGGTSSASGGLAMPDMGARPAGDADAGMASSTAAPPGSASATAGGTSAETDSGGVRAVDASSDSGIPLRSEPPSTYDVADVRSVTADGTTTTQPPAAAAAAVVPAAATTERTYTVVSGDRGFWDVSAKMYGHGKHWPLIRDANPQADPQALQPGDKLRIPPLPAKAATPAAHAGPSGVIVMPTADRPGKYVVEEGDDKGLWGIASKVYDMPVAWQAIRDANPGVRSEALRPGQELVLPARSALPQARARRAAPAAPAQAGTQTYTVMKGDSGFWTVSVKLYGSGKYWPVIQEANPGVEPRRLKEGDVLAVPKLTEEMKRKYGRAGSRPARPEPAPIVETEPSRPPRPIFD
jgi:hypothetical protein